MARNADLTGVAWLMGKVWGAQQGPAEEQLMAEGRTERGNVRVTLGSGKPGAIFTLGNKHSSLQKQIL